MKTAQEFANEYYQLDKSGITSVRIKSAVQFAERYAKYCIEQNLNKHLVGGRAIVPHCIWGVDTDCQLINTCPECTPQASEQLPREGEVTE